MTEKHIGGYIRGLDNAREDFKRMKFLDKLAKRLFGSAAAVITAAVALAVSISSGWILLTAVGFFVGMGGWGLWLYVHEESDTKFRMVSPMSRYQYYRNAVRNAEDDYEKAMQS